MSDSLSLRLEFYNSFIAVCEEKSFSKAAKKVGLSQGAISQHVATLERIYRGRLLERGTESVRLTSTGELVLRRAYEILAVESRLRQEVETAKGFADNTIEIAASTIPGEYLLPAMIKQFRAIRPSVNFEVKVVDSREAWSQLKDNEADFAAVGTLVDDLRPYEIAEIATEELVLIVPIDSALASRNRISIREVLKHPFVSREAGSGTRREIENMLSRAGLSWSQLNTVVQLGSTEAITSAVQQGIGISIVSSIAATKATKNNLVKAIHFSDLDASRRLFLARRRVDASKSGAPRDLTEEFWHFVNSRRMALDS
ncbi:MAG: selenium metabolism-associated LysR family transcriptional regulator [Promethearchaeati archaeon SRVP18_Atabeyarchaeia-1]